MKNALLLDAFRFPLFFPFSFSALGSLIAWTILLCGVVTCLKQRRSFFFFFFLFFYSVLRGVFHLLSWDFLVGMMISRTGWTFCRGILRLYFPSGEGKGSFFFLKVKIGVVTMYAWLGHGSYGEKGLVKVFLCDGAVLRGYSIGDVEW
jgi:hypothetical protein